MAVLRDERAKFGHQSLGELMPHALDHLEACVGNQICGLPACRKRQKRIRRAVNDQRGRRQTPELPGPVPTRQNGQQLPRRSVRIVVQAPQHAQHALEFLARRLVRRP